MGEVYLAHDARLSRRVALKFLSPRLADNPKFRNRFMIEAHAAAAVDHPYVCKIYEVEEVATPYLCVSVALWLLPSLTTEPQGHRGRGGSGTIQAK